MRLSQSDLKPDLALSLRPVLKAELMDSPKLSSRDEAVSVLVEDLEGLLDLLLRVNVAHLSRHHRQELGKVNLAVSVSVNLSDQ